MDTPIPRYAARANSRFQQPFRWRESLHRNDLRAAGKAEIIRAFGLDPEARCGSSERLTSNWHRTPIRS